MRESGKQPLSGSARSITTTPLLSPTGSTTTTATASTKPSAFLDAFDAFANRNGAVGVKSSSSQDEDSKPSATTTPSASSDKKNADIVEFLNAHYSSEALLLAQLPLVRQAVNDRMNTLDDRISSALQKQSESAASTQQHVLDAKASVLSLEQRIRQVQHKANQSETTVREITKDMKRLDLAKRHLQRTITTLKRLHMLIHAVEQLRLASLQQPFPDFLTAAHLVDAIGLLLEEQFKPYLQKVEPMRLLEQKVSGLQEELLYIVMRHFRIAKFGLEKANDLEKQTTTTNNASGKKRPQFQSQKMKHKQPQSEADVHPTLQNLPLMPTEVMTQGMLYVDALGVDSRNAFISIFGQDQLAEYSATFKPVKKEAKDKPRVSSFKVVAEPEPEAKPEFALELVERRFLWFRELLTDVEQKFGKDVFPKAWNIEYLLTKTFLKRTRSHLIALLQGPLKDPEANNATILLKALQKTIQFEKEVTGALQREYGTLFKEATEEGDKAPTTDSKSNTAPSSLGQDTVSPLLGIASSAFDNFMRPYIALEEQSMDEQLVKALEDRAVDTRGELPVYTTSTRLFVYIKGSVTRCTALTKGNTFFLLYRAFQDSLMKYAQVLTSKLPPPLPQKTTGAMGLAQNMAFTKKDGQDKTQQFASYKVPPGEEVTVCNVISTCEYCADTVEALEDLISDTVDEKYKAEISMMTQQEAFHDITAKAVHVLVSGLEGRLEDPYKKMVEINWEIFYEVGEESDYVRHMQRAIQPYVATARGLIPTSYFRSACDKFALAFTAGFYDTLLTIKPINEPGSQQLLLDVQVLKTLFLKLPVLEKSTTTGTPANRQGLPAASSIAPAMYTKMVQKQFKRIEILLKLTGTPVDLLVDVFRDQWHGGKAEDLQTVMSLKGMKRNEQAAMLEKFGLDPKSARKGVAKKVTSASIVTERIQGVANSDFKQMRQRGNEFLKALR